MSTSTTSDGPATPPKTSTARQQSTPASRAATSSQTRSAVGSSTRSTPARTATRRRIKADQSGVLIAGGMLAGTGWVLLARLISGSPPLAFPRWLFFILIYLAVTGTVIPFIWYLNRRFSQPMPVRGGVILRQSMWFGLFAVTTAWLQMTRALTIAAAAFLALSMIVIELFLRLRERGQNST